MVAMYNEATPSTFSSEESFEYFEHNVWNPMLSTLCHSEIGIMIETFLEEANMGRIALSCHFSLDVLCEQTLSLPVVNNHVSIRNWWPEEDYVYSDFEET